MHLRYDYIVHMEYVAIYRANTLHELASKSHCRSCEASAEAEENVERREFNTTLHNRIAA
jgi:hypothetical protein